MTTSLQRWIEERQEEHRRQQGGGASYADRAREAQEAVRADQQVDLITVPRGYSQSTEAAFADAGYDLDEIIPLHGQFEGDADDPLSDPDLGPVIRELRSEARPERPDPRPTISRQRAGLDESTEGVIQSALERAAGGEELTPRFEDALSIYIAGLDRGDREPIEVTGQLEGDLSGTGIPVAGPGGGDAGGSNILEQMVDRYAPDGSIADGPEQGDPQAVPAQGSVLGGGQDRPTLEQDDTAEDRLSFWDRARNWFTGGETFDISPTQTVDRSIYAQDLRDAYSDLGSALESRERDMVDPPVPDVEYVRSGGQLIPASEQPEPEQPTLDDLEDTVLPTVLDHIERTGGGDLAARHLPEDTDLVDLVDRLASSQDMYNQLLRQRERAEALGIEHDPDPDGLLRTALDVVGRPVSAVYGFASGLAHGDDEQADESRLRTAARQAREGLMGEEQFSSRDLTGIDTEDMPWWERAELAVGHFALDVVGDPISWMTFGGGGLVRRAAAEGVERSIGQAASRAGWRTLSDLPDEQQLRLLNTVGGQEPFSELAAREMRQIAPRVGRRTDTDVAAPGRHARQIDASDVDEALRHGETPSSVLRAFEELGMPPDVREDLLQRGLKNMMGGAYNRSGSTGLRRQIESVFGDDAVFRQLDHSLRGGLQLTVPFVSRRAEFGTAPRSLQVTPGGGSNPGAEAAADLYNHLRRWVAKSQAGQQWQRAFAGRNSHEVQALSRALYQGSDETAGVAWAQFAAARDANLIRGEVARRMRGRNRDAFVTMSRHLQAAGDESMQREAKEAMNLFMYEAGSPGFNARTGMSTAIDADAPRKVVERGLDELTPEAVEAGRRAWMQMDSTLREMASDVVNSAPDPHQAMNLLNNYTPRRLAEEFAEARHGTGVGGTNHLKHRTGAYATWRRDPTTGELQIEAFHSPAEVRVGAEVRGDPLRFNEDAAEALVDYVATMDRVVQTQTVLQHLQRQGLIQAPGTRPAGILREQTVADVLEPASQAAVGARQDAVVGRAYAQQGNLERAEDMLGPLRDLFDESELDDIIRNLPRARVSRDGDQWVVDMGDAGRHTFASHDEALAAADRHTTSAAYETLANRSIDRVLRDERALDQALDIRNLSFDDPEALARQYESISELVGRWTNESRSRVARRLRGGDQRVPDAYGERLQDANWAAFSKEAKDAYALRSMAESGAFAPRQIVESLNRQFRAQQDVGMVADFMESVWQPYYTGFKTLATVGRGPGFSIRNALGGMWNAYLAGATASHFNTAQRMMTQEHAAKQQVLRQIRESGEVPTPDELTRRIQDAVRERYRSSFGEERGERLYQALESFYERDLMTGSRVHEYQMQSTMFRSESAVATYAGGPTAAGFTDDVLGQQGRLSRIGRWADRPTRAAQVDAMDPALARGAGVSDTIFPGRTRQELGGVRRGLQAAVDNPWVRMNSQLAEVSEKYTRLAPYLKGLDRYGLEDGGRAAALGVKATQFDYADLTEFERRVMRNLMPFYTFTRNNVPLQLRAMFTEPERFARLGHGWTATQEAFGADERWEESILPRWVRDNLGFVTRYSPADTPGADVMSQVPVVGRMFDSQYPIAVNMSSLPVTDLEKLTAGASILELEAGSARDEVISQLNPLVTGTYEALTGVDTFTRGEPPDYEALWQPAQPDDGEQVRWPDFVPGVHQQADGTVVARRPPLQAARNIVPPASQAERLLGGTERTESRMMSSIGSNLAGLPISTIDDWQLMGQISRQREDVDDAIRALLGRDIDRSTLWRLMEEVGAEPIQEAIDRGELPELIRWYEEQ